MPRPEFLAFVPLLSFNIADMPSEETAAQLNQHQIFCSSRNPLRAGGPQIRRHLGNRRSKGLSIRIQQRAGN